MQIFVGTALEDERPFNPVLMLSEKSYVIYLWKNTLFPLNQNKIVLRVISANMVPCPPPPPPKKKKNTYHNVMKPAIFPLVKSENGYYYTQ